MEINNNQKLLSVIIPFHNRTDLLIKTINSLTKELSSNYELLLIDDGSKENAFDQIKKYLKSNIKYFKINHSERGYARNYGVYKANGMYVNFFDSDDLALDNHFSSFKSFINDNNFPNIFANSHIIKRNREIKVIQKGILNKKIFKQNILSCNSVFIKKNFFLEYKFSEDINLSGSEDWDLWLRIASKEKIIGNNIVSSILVDHNFRSTKIQNIDKAYKRIDTLHKRISEVENFNLGKNLFTVKSEIYSFKSLLYSPVFKKKLLSIKFFFLSIYHRPSRVFEIRTYVIIKKIIFDFI